MLPVTAGLIGYRTTSVCQVCRLQVYGVLLQLYQAFGQHEVAQSGIGNVLMGSPTFWFSIILVYFITFSARHARLVASIYVGASYTNNHSRAVFIQRIAGRWAIE